MNKVNSIIKKGASLLKDGADPYLEGKKNFENNTDILKNNLDICKGCRYFKQEPIPDFRVLDKKYPELSGKSCGKCGCILSYKLRQDIKLCKKWQTKE